MRLQLSVLGLLAFLVVAPVSGQAGESRVTVVVFGAAVGTCVRRERRTDLEASETRREVDRLGCVADEVR